MAGRKFAEKIVDVKRIVDDTLTDREDFDGRERDDQRGALDRY